MKRFLLMLICMACLLTGCRGIGEKTSDPEEEKQLITVGFSQLGAESDWRKANTESMLQAFTEENGYELIMEDGQQKQVNQITAIRTFIQREVDYIVLAPVTEEGWETVLEEAKDAGIPVIIVDRQVKVKDKDLFTCWVGSDFALEGRKATEWLHAFTRAQGIDPAEINVVDIQGTLGSSAQIGRSAGILDASKKYGWKLLAQVSGEYTQARGREVMNYFLKVYDQINVVYCENDNEALGVIEAVEAAGRKVGSDIRNGEILVMSFDGVNETALQFAREDKISCIGECNPLHGPRVRKIIESLEKGETPEKYEYVDESIFSSLDQVQAVEVDGESYPVTLLK
ncbi:MAG: ABC transporter substrate-binding protein [Lachnospiraceae bacterium]|nr:ABC transporter substrate-binding protein [Lachnospiraceae bacterium]